MKRFALQQLVDWKSKNNRKPMLINGARQVGKTWLMEEFGRKYFEKTAIFNLQRNSALRNLFTKDLDPKRILLGFELEAGFKIDPQKTLIVIDEIQEEPRAITALKYFYEDTPEYHIVAAGSLLGVTLHSGVSFPVGKVDMMNVYPLCFREFLCAIGEELLAEQLKDGSWDILQPFHDKLLDYIKQYMFIGGMPEVVADFAEQKDFTQVREKQNNILKAYADDFSKHIPTNVLHKVNLVWQSIPAQLSKENKKYAYNQVVKNGRSKDFEAAITWLKDAGLIYKLQRLSKPFLPISSYKQENIFKIFLLDVGLLSAMSGLDRRVLLESDALFTEFKGAITEQYVLQELVAMKDIDVAYWANDTGNAELDFIAQLDGTVIPIEVKSGINLKAKSLKTYADKFSPKLAVRFSQANAKQTENLYDIPLYAISRLQNIL